MIPGPRPWDIFSAQGQERKEQSRELSDEEVSDVLIGNQGLFLLNLLRRRVHEVPLHDHFFKESHEVFYHFTTLHEGTFTLCKCFYQLLAMHDYRGIIHYGWNDGMVQLTNHIC